MKLSAATILMLTGLLIAACGGGAPDIDLPQSQMDFGVVTNGEIRTMEVTVLNAGSADLIIEAATTSCGCTSAAVTPEVVPAGGAAMLTVSYDSGAHGPDEVGPVMRQIFIASNDPDEPEIEFRFTAEVTAADP